MSDQAVEIERIEKVFGDRVLVKRFTEPEKKRGLYVPQAYLVGKKEPRKVWWGQVVAFGTQSRAHEKEGLNLSAGERVGLEPLGHHYASFKGEDGHDYVWVPDEHFCLADEGSIAAYYSDQLDRKGEPRFRLLGDRVLLRPLPEKEGLVVRPPGEQNREAREAEVIMLGKFEEGLDPGLTIGDRVLHVADDAGTSAKVDLFDPPLVVLRGTDLIAKMKEQVPA